MATRHAGRARTFACESLEGRALLSTINALMDARVTKDITAVATATDKLTADIQKFSPTSSTVKLDKAIINRDVALLKLDQSLDVKFDAKADPQDPVDQFFDQQVSDDITAWTADIDTFVTDVTTKPFTSDDVQTDLDLIDADHQTVTLDQGLDVALEAPVTPTPAPTTA